MAAGALRFRHRHIFQPAARATPGCGGNGLRPRAHLRFRGPKGTSPRPSRPVSGGLAPRRAARRVCGRETAHRTRPRPRAPPRRELHAGRPGGAGRTPRQAPAPAARGSAHRRARAGPDTGAHPHHRTAPGSAAAGGRYPAPARPAAATARPQLARRLRFCTQGMVRTARRHRLCPGSHRAPRAPRRLGNRGPCQRPAGPDCGTRERNGRWSRRRRGGGAAHRSAGRDPGARVGGHAGLGSRPSARDLGTPHGPRRRHRLHRRAFSARPLAGARAAGDGDPHRGRGRAPRFAVLPSPRRRSDPHPAGVSHGRRGPARPARRSQSALDAARRPRRARGSAARTGESRFRLVPDVVRGRRRPGRDLRAARAASHRTRRADSARGRAAVSRARTPHHRGGGPFHASVRRLALPAHRDLRSAREPRRRAPHRLLDHAERAARAAAYAFRPRPPLSSPHGGRGPTAARPRRGGGPVAGDQRRPRAPRHRCAAVLRAGRSLARAVAAALAMVRPRADDRRARRRPSRPPARHARLALARSGGGAACLGRGADRGTEAGSVSA